MSNDKNSLPLSSLRGLHVQRSGETFAIAASGNLIVECGQSAIRPGQAIFRFSPVSCLEQAGGDHWPDHLRRPDNVREIRDLFANAMAKGPEELSALVEAAGEGARGISCWLRGERDCYRKRVPFADRLITELSAESIDAQQLLQILMARA